MAGYRATTTLNTKGGFIRKGELVPKSYPRFAEAIKRGWIELVDDKLADVKIANPIVPESKLESEPELKPKPKPELKPKPKPAIEPESVLSAEPESVDDETKASSDKPEPTVHNKTIESLDFLAFGRCEILHADGIYTLEDLRGISATDLSNIKGVGFKTANKLIGAFDVYNEEISKTTRED